MSHSKCYKYMGMMVALGLLALNGAIAANETLPFVDGFESGNLSGAEWTATATGDGSATPSAASKLLGSYGCYVTNAVLALDMAEASNYTNVWIHLLTKPGLFNDAAPEVSGVSAAFYVSDAGVLRAYTNSAWGDVTNGLPTGSWLGFLVHLDYSGAGTYDLYVDTSPTGPNDKFQRVGVGLQMASTKSNQLNQVVIEDLNKGAYIDNVAGSRSHVLVAAAGANYDNVLVTATPDIGKSEDFAPNPGTHDAIEDELDTRLGTDLLSGVEVGDELTYIDQDGDAYVFDVVDTPMEWNKKSGTIEVGDFDWPITKGASLSRVGGSKNAYAFLGFDTMNPGPASAPIYGSGSLFGGWNQLTNPEENGDITTPAEAAALFPNAMNGDEIWFRKNGEYYLWWTFYGGSWHTDQGPLRAGQSFWYKRKGGDTTWAPGM